ncbi:ankyrin repeat domain-containing protein 13B-like [Clytia hemisphaerica]|uniref:Ankyrin repeat domain-containing protein n=1 Tax=Clytia hemisphaerica TaxID=252671 RepID=A0A7M5VB53_9CNID
MKWEFSSWIPLVSRVCPSDSYKIYKSGNYVRVDTTLKGFEQMNWQRGNQSFIFKAGAKSSDFYEVDHDKKCYWKESIKTRDDNLSLENLVPPTSVISSRFRAPNVTISLDHDNISFARQKSGFPWFGQEKTEKVNGYEAKVFSVSGVEMVTRTRTEHMSEDDLRRLDEEKKRNESQLPSMLNFLKQEESKVEMNTSDIVNESSTNPYGMTVEQYFNPKSHPSKDVGRLRKMTSKSQKFSATVALSDSFPLSLNEQVLPVINLMANSNSHFAKLRDFITLQLPAGFPIKIEIPLFHVLNARITFGNINGVEKCPDGVIVLEEDAALRPVTERVVSETPDQGSSTPSPTPPKTRCIIDKSIFEVHHKYRDLGTDVNMYRSDSTSYRDEEDELLQLAIQQSLAETSGGEGGNPQDAMGVGVGRSREDEDMERAIRESLISQGIDPPPVTNQPVSNTPSIQTGVEPPAPLARGMSEEEQFMLAMRLSSEETENASRLAQDEDDELERVLKLSMEEK